MTQVTCPVCNGTKRKPAGDRWKSVTYGYDKETDTLLCTNCGGQTMSLRPTGMVNQNSEGNPCTHSYTSETIGRCLTRYTCKHCNDQYTIDSGD
jgi:hypothetical protein